ncbi:lysophospholipid acyltransferase family protein [Arcobacter sp. FWKO B]|uniref:lysophospholipid acyltransferase family protein n=1 Tax=Arcobacter sp. FWKO B TaxID=2593672 RepID=UPI0018A661C8|nr:lysophospholipid acyltransferase family protein [Arcobacter sp. FWKO B]QOG12400.1 GNAT family N-acetyltransferase [Arcobacter sp. FWKO B]
MISIQREIQNKYPTLGNQSIIKFLQKIIHEDKINAFLEENSHLMGFEFVEAILDYFNFDIILSQNQIQNIPTSGSVVIIANHPLGALDGLLLLKIIGSIRKDVKIVANDFLTQFTQLDPLLLKVNNFNQIQIKQDIKAIVDELKQGKAVIIFPSGEVSRARLDGIKDTKWYKGFLTFAINSKSPILPIHIKAKNSWFFYTVSAINKRISTLLLSNEMFNKQNKKATITIGEIIPYENIPQHIKKKELIVLFKKHLYSINKLKPILTTQKAIAHPQSRQAILEELQSSQVLGSTSDGKKIYLYSYKDDSTILKEIGRLRELSFRKVGEGVNKKRDTDKYDKYYSHIILWDEKELEIVGSYRIGNSNHIMSLYGEDGFYTSSLFNYNSGFANYLQDSIELGRSFVQPKYWGTRALDYLWYGIGAYLKNHRNIKYMFGAVSLSSTYPSIAKDLIINYYSNYFKDSNNLVTPKNPYQYSNNLNEVNYLFGYNDKKLDFKILKSALNDVGFVVPTLYKQYSDLCEDDGVKFLGFNTDTNFSNCVDGFILVDISKIKTPQKNRYINN